MSTTLIITKLEVNNSIKITQEGSPLFIADDSTLIIPIENFALILNLLIKKNILSPKVLEGILEEVYNDW